MLITLLDLLHISKDFIKVYRRERRKLLWRAPGFIRYIRSERNVAHVKQRFKNI